MLTRADPTLDRPVILFQYIVEILHSGCCKIPTTDASSIIFSEKICTPSLGSLQSRSELRQNRICISQTLLDSYKWLKKEAKALNLQLVAA
jgi:hypothetical protein